MSLKINFIRNSCVITLDRPKSYNATDLNTVNAFHDILIECLQRKDVERIIIVSEHDKVFCSGGDIKLVYQNYLANNLNASKEFFAKEYSLVLKMANYEKPIISLVNGICFGGGMGISMHNTFNVITENAVLAMPETIIGFFPDVGASYKFSKFSNGLKNFYGLTGYPIPPHLSIKYGLASCFILSSSLEKLFSSLCICEKGQELEILKKFSSLPPVKNEYSFVEEIFDNSLENILDLLEKSLIQEAKIIYEDLKKRSPFSLCLTYELLKKSNNFSLEESLNTDKILAYKFLNHPDFKEGVRAQIIDKDKNPKWKFKNVKEVSYNEVCEFLNS